MTNPLNLNETIYVLTIYHNAFNDPDYLNRFYLFRNMFKDQTFTVTTVECLEENIEFQDALPSPDTTKTLYLYKKGRFNYYSAVLKGISALPSNWSRVLLVDFNVEFSYEENYECSIKKEFERCDVFQIFEKAFKFNPNTKELIDSFYSLAFSLENSIPIDREYFPLWYPDAGAGWGMKREFFNAIQEDLEKINGVHFSAIMLGYMFSHKSSNVINSVKDSFNVQPFQNISEKAMKFKFGYANLTIFRYSMNNLYAYEEFSQEYEMAFFNKGVYSEILQSKCGIYPEVKQKFEILDYALEINERRSNGNLLKNIWDNISGMNIEVERVLTFNSKRQIVGAKNEKVMTIQLDMMNRGEISTVNSEISFEEDFLPSPDVEILYEGQEENLMAQYGKCQSVCKCIEIESGVRVRRIDLETGERPNYNDNGGSNIPGKEDDQKGNGLPNTGNDYQEKKQYHPNEEQNNKKNSIPNNIQSDDKEDKEKQNDSPRKKEEENKQNVPIDENKNVQVEQEKNEEKHIEATPAKDQIINEEPNNQNKEVNEVSPAPINQEKEDSFVIYQNDQGGVGNADAHEASL